MSHSKATLLIVDDNPDNLRVLSAILNDQNYRVRKAISGEMALDTIQAELPDLILLDIKMPDMDGYTVCQQLKQNDTTCEVPIIFLSALDDAPDKAKAFSVGGADYITKPFQAEEVLIRIQHQLTIQQQRHQINHLYRERSHLDAENQLLRSTITTVNQAASLNEALCSILRNICQTLMWDYSEAWVLKGDVLELSQPFYTPNDVQLQALYETRAGLTMTRGQGWVGQVWAEQHAQWLDDITQSEHLSDARPAAIAARLNTAVAVPIQVGNQLVAVFTFFSRAQRSPDFRILQLMEAIALQLGGFVQHQLAAAILQDANRKLQCMVDWDGLTQIANRHCFDTTIYQEWQRLCRDYAPVSLLLCDIDAFKAYNEQQGHLNGDSCLQQVAQAIAQICKRPADLVARYEGDTFAVLLPNTEIDGATHLAAQIQQAIIQLAIPRQTPQTSDPITLSIGIGSIIPALGESLERFIAATEQALITAKAQGHNSCVTSSVTESVRSLPPLV